MKRVEVTDYGMFTTYMWLYEWLSQHCILFDEAVRAKTTVMKVGLVSGWVQKG